MVFIDGKVVFNISLFKLILYKLLLIVGAKNI